MGVSKALLLSAKGSNFATKEMVVIDQNKMKFY